MRKKYLTPVALLAWLFLYTVSFAQTLPFKHYSVEDGLVSSSVSCIFQDSGGYLWIGTEQGISRFNGVDFKDMSMGGESFTGFIFDIFEARNGDIWIGTEAGGAARFRSGEFTFFTTRNGLPHNRVSSICEDREGNLWFGTREGIAVFDGTDFTGRTRADGPAGGDVRDMVMDKKGNIWIGTGEGLCCFTGGRFINYTPAGPGNSPGNAVRVLKTGRGGALWIGTEGGLYRFREGTFTSFTEGEGLPVSYIHSVAEDRNGSLWIGTDNGACYFSGGTVTTFNRAHGLPDDTVSSIFEDREGNIWFGTILGLSRLSSLRFVNYTVKDGLPHNLIWGIIEERPGIYRIATGKGLSRFARGTFKNLTTRDGLVNDSVHKLVKDRWGKIWAATRDGISVYRHGKFTNYTVKDGLPHNTVLSILEDREGVIWLGTARGICRFMDGVFTVPAFERDGTPVQFLSEDRGGNVWYSNNKGLYKVSGDKRVRYTTRDGLANDMVYSFFEDRRGRFWLGTQQGLSCFDRGKFTNYTTADGLADNVCYFLLGDDRDNLWIGTRRGINRFDGVSFKTYTTRDGLSSYEVGHGACLKDSRGYLWFGTVKGLTRYDPGQDRVNTVPPPVYITDFTVFDETYPMDRPINLEYNRNYLKFSFTGLSFTSPGDVSYRYRLEGIDHRWFRTGNRFISYPYLPHGDYTFKVFAVNNDGIESERPAEIRFRILPPFWETWWFQLFSVLFVSAVLLMIVLWKIKREKEKIANRERNKQLVMAQKMELLGILAGGAVHDLKNLLSIIIGYSKIAVKQAGAGDEKLRPIENIKNTAVTAVHVVKQILAFTRQKYDETTAANLPDLLDDILEILKVTAPAGIKILWEPPGEEIRLYINPTRFQQVVMNLCLNALHAMEGNTGGELDIRLDKTTDNRVRLRVRDTGTGMDRGTIEKIFDPLFTTKEPGKGTGLGLFVVKQVMDEYNGKIEVRSTPGEGTTFTLSW